MMMHDRRFVLALSLAWGLAALVLLASVRGLSGNPTVADLGTVRWREDGPFELSPERGRFALLYAVVEDRTLAFSVLLAETALPDLAVTADGRYASLFAPAVSFLAIPGYLLGRAFGVAQVGAFLTVTAFALANMVLIRTISVRLGASRAAGLLAALTFGFATPAFAYGSTLYQHHVSTCLLLLSILLLLRFRHYGAYAAVWFLCALSVVVDNPNLFLMLPVGIAALSAQWRQVRKRLVPRHVLAHLLTVSVMVLPMGAFLWYNHAAYGDWFQLPGTLRSVSAIDDSGRPADLPGETSSENEKDADKREKTAVGFFETRNMYGGLFTLFVSRDRGVLFYTPVIVLGVIGMAVLYRTRPDAMSLLTSVAGMNILLYAMWGDPWGGWAFGGRYLIPTYAVLAIGLAQAWSVRGRRALLVSVFIPLLAYSLWVNTLGAVTTSMIPPKIQVLAMERQSGHEEKYTFMRSWQFLHRTASDVGVKSFAYQAWARRFMTPETYFYSVYALALLAFASAALALPHTDDSRSDL